MPEAVTATALREAWTNLSPEERLASFRALPRLEEEEFFLELPAPDQAELLLLPAGEQRAWMRLLAPDDATDLIQAAPPDARERLLGVSWTRPPAAR